MRRTAAEIVDGGARCLSSSPTASSSCCSARAPRRSSASPRIACSTRRRFVGMRPIITRTERVAVNIADGFARATNGERFVPCVTQYGPGAEAAFAAVAQAFGDRSPILLLPSEHAVRRAGHRARAAQRAGLRADHALRGHRQRRRARPRGIPAGAERAARRAQRPRAGGDRQRRAQRPGGRRRLGREDVAAAADAGERRRRRADRASALLGADASGDPGRPGRALRRRDGRAGAPRRAHRHAGGDDAQRQERVPRGPSARARHGGAHATGHGRPLPRAGRPRARHRHELHALALHHAHAGRSDARADHRRPPRSRDRLRRRVRLRRRRAPRAAAAARRDRARRAASGARRPRPRWPTCARHSWTSGCAHLTSDASPAQPVSRRLGADAASSTARAPS